MGFRVLLIGGEDSRLYQQFYSRFEELTFSLLQVDAEALSSSEAMSAFFEQHQPNVILSLIGAGSVSREDVGHAGYLSSAASRHTLPVIHISNYRVFPESEALSGAIGESSCLEKMDTESNLYFDLERAFINLPLSVVLRTSWIVDEKGYGLLDTFLPAIMTDNLVGASDHNYANPVYTRTIADAAIAILQQILCGAKNWGVFHFHSSDKCSEAEFADHLKRLLVSEFDMAESAIDVAGVDDDRHLMSEQGLLSGARCTDDFGIQFVSWKNGLKKEVARWLQEEGNKF